MFFAQLKNELWKLFGKKRTYIGFGAFVLAQSAILLLLKYGRKDHFLENALTQNGFDPSEYMSALTISFFMVLPQAILLMPLYVALVGGDMVAKEAEDGTLRMILSRPISRVRLLVVKWLGGIIFATVLVLVLGVTAVSLARIFFPWKGMFVIAQTPEQHPIFAVFTPAAGLQLYAFAQVFMVANSITMMTVAFMFSSFNMKPAAATILALSFLFVSMVMQRIPSLDPYRNWFVTYHFEKWIFVFQNPTPWPQLLQSEVILAAISATAFLIGVIGFQMRDIKS